MGAGLRLSLELLGPEYSMSANSLDAGGKRLLQPPAPGRRPGRTSSRSRTRSRDSCRSWAARPRSTATKARTATSRAFLDGKQPELDFHAGLDVTELLMTCYMSAEQERVVDYPPKDRRVRARRRARDLEALTSSVAVRRRRAWLAFVLVSGLLSSNITAVAAPTPTGKPALPPDLDGFVARTLREFEVPGLALAIVKDGQPLLLKGYGVRRLGAPAPVTPQTLFGIASNTKAFTAAALAMLVDEGKLSWDDPVTKHLPAFQLFDPYVTREMTVRDLLTHRSGLGLGAGDLMFFPPSTFTRDEIVEQLRYIKPATSFRSKYAYDNCLYLVAGQIIPAVTGKSWDDFVKARIFTPLGMTTSNTSVSALAADGDVATPHSLVDKVVTPVAPHSLDNNAPAGGINSSVAEMSRWVIAQLDGGVYHDAEGHEQRLFSLAQGKEMWTAQTLLPISDPPKELAARARASAAYGLGWGLRDYRGRKLVSHTGGLLGMVSQVMLVPEEKLGIVVLTNQEQGAAFRAVTWRLLDHFLGAPPFDWVGGLEERVPPRRGRSATGDGEAVRGPVARLEAGAAAVGLLSPLSGRLVRRGGDRDGGRQTGDPLQPYAVARGRPRALAVRDVRRALARPFPECGCLRDLRPRARGPHRAHEDGARLAPDGLQLRFQGSLVHGNRRGQEWRGPLSTLAQ